jgi:hypothetical protein
MTPMSQPEISDEFLALLGGAIKRTHVSRVPVDRIDSGQQVSG